MSYRRKLKTEKPPLPGSIVLILGGLEKLADFSYSVLSKEALYPARRDCRMKRERWEREVSRRKKIKQALRRLEKAEHVTFDKKRGTYHLTPSGWLKFIKYYNTYNKKNKKRTAKGDYIIMFDIPEEHKRFRDLFRACLVNLGCEYIQKSNFYTQDKDVFVFAQKIVANCELSEYVKFVEANKIY